MTAAADDPWLLQAIHDDSVVANLLLRLTNSDSHTPSHLLTKGTAASVPAFWGIRQPRSRSGGVSASTSKKEGETTTTTTRLSPTTPLSWSGGGGGGGGGRSGGGASASDECEESSLLFPSSDRFSSAVRSKGIGTNETTTTANKRSRKKTFAELKEEESLLLKEQSYLEKELETIRATLKQQRSLNHNLKRKKIDLGLESITKFGATLMEKLAQNSSTTPCLTEASMLEETSSCAPIQIMHNDHPLHESCPPNENTGDHDQPVFLLPDLNMLPEDFGPEILVGAS